MPAAAALFKRRRLLSWVWAMDILIAPLRCLVKAAQSHRRTALLAEPTGTAVRGERVGEVYGGARNGST
jgi:hypothetical protein